MKRCLLAFGNCLYFADDLIKDSIYDSLKLLNTESGELITIAFTVPNSVFMRQYV